MILKMTEAATDQEHLEMIIYNCPSIPDRTSHILGKSKRNPVIPMLEIANKLVSLDVDYIAIPCITAHFYHSLLSQNIAVPILNMIRETALYLKNNNVESAGLLATEGTVFCKLFQEELRLHGIRLVTPSKKGQEAVNHLIYDTIKAGQPFQLDQFSYASDELKHQGCEVIIIGCTELSIVKRDYELGAGYLDALEVLAAQSVLSCDMGLKEEYKDLITR
ncbi:amino acid racemase [Anaerocolumna sp. AGMB13025]|nr:amino acid racemase [Anaerocolumna sp. AGMB13025]WFR57693.1 amino acid racemase [Anaerocolumna sp. AGMB13025]